MPWLLLSSHPSPRYTVVDLNPAFHNSSGGGGRRGRDKKKKKVSQDGGEEGSSHIQETQLWQDILLSFIHSVNMY